MGSWVDLCVVFFRECDGLMRHRRDAIKFFFFFSPSNSDFLFLCPAKCVCQKNNHECIDNRAAPRRERRYVEDETAKVDHINREVDAMTRELDRVLATQTDHDRLQERVKELEGDVASANPGKGDGAADESPPPKRGWFGL